MPTNLVKIKRELEDTVSLEVVVPGEWCASQKLRTTLSSGQRVTINPPHGMAPGSTIEFTLPRKAVTAELAAAATAGTIGAVSTPSAAEREEAQRVRYAAAYRSKERPPWLPSLGGKYNLENISDRGVRVVSRDNRGDGVGQRRCRTATKSQSSCT